MRSLQSVSRAILFPLSVLVLCANGPGVLVSAVSAPSGLLSGAAALKTLSLEEDSATLASSPEHEVVNVSTENIAIRAINPGYTTDAGKNSGELIELVKLTEDELDLSNVKIIYQSKTATRPIILYDFPKGSKFIGDSILLRYSGSPETAEGNQDVVYDASLAMTGSISLVITTEGFSLDTFPENQTTLSSVCWLGGEDCLPNFSTTVKSRSYTTILRDDDTGEYYHTNNPELLYDGTKPGLYLPPEFQENAPDSTKSEPSSSTTNGSTSSSNGSDFDLDAPPVCTGLEFSEFLTYYSDDPSEQFIELYNRSTKTINLSKCRLRYKKKLYYFIPQANKLDQGMLALDTSSSNLIAPNSYYIYRPEITLTKNPTSELLYEIVDINGDVVDSVLLPHGQKKKTSYALTDHGPDGSEIWQVTYDPTPGTRNTFQEFQTCPAGKVINVLTGNCVNTTTMKSSLNDCGAGKYRNPETGRCKSYSSSSTDDPTPCKEGYERNPETNRCRKIKNNSGAEFPIVPLTNTTEQTSFIALWAIIAIATLGLGYVIFQFRKEILYSFRKLLTKFKRQ